MDSLQISTGQKRISITRDGAHVGEVVFNPADVVFAEKFYKIVGEFETTLSEYQSQYDSLEKDAKGIPVEMGKALTLLHDSCVYVREKIDYVFGENVSQIVFGDAMNMEIFPQFFDGIIPHIRTARAEKIAPYLVKKSSSGSGRQHKKISK